MITQLISGRGNNVNINGKNIKVPNGASISIQNGTLYVNGKEYTDGDLKDKHIINITIEGNVDRVRCDGSVTVKGDIKNGIDCGGSVNITGDVTGSIDCGGSVMVKGKQRGTIDCGGSVVVGGRI